MNELGALVRSYRSFVNDPSSRSTSKVQELLSQVREKWTDAVIKYLKPSTSSFQLCRQIITYSESAHAPETQCRLESVDGEGSQEKSLQFNPNSHCDAVEIGFCIR